MEQTIKNSNLEFINDVDELMIDAALNEGVLKVVPILGTIVGVSKCIKNVYDVFVCQEVHSVSGSNQRYQSKREG